ncbi:MAG: pseudouridine synthase [Alphaproteobacteria bacterium]|nr:pseudouridine synthase [Alphaproteobacteria bacterium]MBO4644616.1 pseudouridine synthase [Alphaproteobacteria bacterium]
MSEYLNNLCIALSQLINALLFGNPDETFAARCYRNSYKGSATAKLMCKILDFLFKPFHENHCQKMHEEEVLDNQQGKDYDI